LCAECAVSARVIVAVLEKVITTVYPDHTVNEYVFQAEVDIHLVLVVPEAILPSDYPDATPHPPRELEGFTP
jgi:hypothetical protein